MASLTQNPYKRFKAAAKGKKLDGNEVHAMMKHKGLNLSGSFGGKSNTLGHGGRAAQLRSQGVPGGVIGNLARAAGAAPGGPNYHGGKSKKKRKAPLPPKQELGMAMKRKAGSTVEMDGVGDPEHKRKQAPHLKQTLKARKRKAGSTIGFADVEEKDKGGASCAKCKAAHKHHKGHAHKGKVNDHDADDKKKSKKG